MALITTEGLHFLQQICKIANSLNIEGIIFEPNENRIRGVDEQTSIIILDNRDLSGYFKDFDMLCINRVSHFLNRLSLVLTGQKEYEVELLTQNAIVGTSPDPLIVVTAISLSNGKTRVDYRCAGAGVIKAPKRLKNNRDPIVAFSLSEENAQLIQKISSAMSSGISSKDQLLEIEFFGSILKVSSYDSIGDECSFKIDKNDFQAAEDSEHICKKYPLPHILSCIKLTNGPVFSIRPNGFIETVVGESNVKILIIPKANLQ